MNRRQVTAVLFATAQTAVLTIVATNNSEKGWFGQVSSHFCKRGEMQESSREESFTWKIRLARADCHAAGHVIVDIRVEEFIKTPGDRARGSGDFMAGDLSHSDDIAVR